MLRMILWLEICIMIGHDTNPYQVYEVRMKHEWVKRKHTRWRLWNSNEIIVLPKDYLSLSNVGLNRHFLRTIGIRQNKTIFDHETQLVTATAVHWLGYQVLRKPPDKYHTILRSILTPTLGQDVHSKEGSRSRDREKIMKGVKGGC